MVAALLAFGAFLYSQVAGTRELRRKRLLQLGDRSPIEFDEFWSRFYFSSRLQRDRVEYIRKQLASALEIPAALLHPDDRFAVELRPPKNRWVVEDSAFSLLVLTRTLEKKYDRHVDLRSVKSVDEYIRAFCEPLGVAPERPAGADPLA